MHRSESVKDIIWPTAFIICLGYLMWYFPQFIVLLGWANDAIASQNPPADALDFLMLFGAIATLVVGIVKADTTIGEGVVETPFDRVSLFLGRATMMLIVVLVAVMTYEVIVRYVFERPTLWANELSLWMAGFIFLLAGLYAMQQRSHIRIYLLYDVMPRWLQRLCDIISAALIVVFALAMVYGSYNEAHAKFLRWETFGTAFDPPIPATLKPMILLLILLVAIQAVFNLIADWNKLPEHHAIIDEEEVEDIIHSVEEHSHKVEKG
ncbi:TRAP transporter small permease [Actibacterium sp. MT2.3-13A]|uniref:TRAP transporter small permease subunit n=1 Tax=Actibacterium sp. MT2.3-13A TaxID=2828332 RepID=UPI001BA4C616|nr:TRAP transporter small permease [Actibacterium sp. MT2.3-13A]